MCDLRLEISTKCNRGDFATDIHGFEVLNQCRQRQLRHPVLGVTRKVSRKLGSELRFASVIGDEHPMLSKIAVI